MIDNTLEYLIQEMLLNQCTTKYDCYSEFVDAHSTGITQRLRRYAILDLQQFLEAKLNAEEAEIDMEYGAANRELNRISAMWQVER